jgi:retron-type reverse transcriptase
LTRLPKPGGGQRGLGIPNVVDRAVQQAVLQILEPIVEPTFHHSSHGCYGRPSMMWSWLARLRFHDTSV